VCAETHSQMMTCFDAVRGHEGDCSSDNIPLQPGSAETCRYLINQ